MLNTWTCAPKSGSCKLRLSLPISSDHFQSLQEVVHVSSADHFRSHPIAPGNGARKQTVLFLQRRRAIFVASVFCFYNMNAPLLASVCGFWSTCAPFSGFACCICLLCSGDMPNRKIPEGAFQVFQKYDYCDFKREFE